MKYFVYGVNCLLILLLSVVLFIGVVPKKSKTIATDVAVRQLQSGILKNIKEVVAEEESTSAEVEDALSTVEVEESATTSSIVTEEESFLSQEEEPVSVVSDVLETQIGKMSGYGPDCIGCSGYLASGKYVGDGTIFYSDPTYGSVRILAGDSQYPFGTIVRVKNSRLSEFLGIVLDRGGSIGHGKTFLFDLLYASEALAYQDEVSYNVTFEILRYGY